ncbi:MAG: esterase [Oscillospiraceae bacterium]|nr:esterase [Oscillospiraceae bacterium]
MKTYVFGDPKAPVCLIQPVDDHDLEGIRNEYEKIRELTGMDFCLTAIKVNDWNKDLSPWVAPAVFGIENFGDGAADTLKEILSLCTDKDKKYYIGGYSLAGLFSLWASVQTDRFEGVAAASPSVWFPDFLEYIRERKPLCRKIYLSLGDKEEKTRNPVMATVGDKIRELDSFLAREGFDCVLEWNEGNHFKDFDIRTAKAFASVMSRQ